MPFRRFGTISSDPATMSPWISGPLPQAGAGSIAPCSSTSSTPARAGTSASPSFLIRSAQASPSGSGTAGSSWSPLPPRLDRINSAALLRQAREVYFGWLSSAAAMAEPLGIVLNGAGGRVVFELPVLLPAELFVPIEWLRQRAGPRSRGPRAASTPRSPI